MKTYAQSSPTVPAPYSIKSNDSVLVYDIPYATIAKTDLWRDGVTQNGCFQIANYTTTDFPPSADSITMVMRIYHKKYPGGVLPSNIPVHLFLTGGGYLPTAKGIQFMTAGSKNDLLARYYAMNGFISVVIDYRKGWDVKTANPYNSFPINLAFGWNVCPCESNNSCKPFTFMEATYRMVQDIRAAHRKLLSYKTYLNIDPNNIYYGGISTGAIAVMSAAFASDDLPNYNEYTNNSGRTLSNITSCGPIDKFGVPLANGEIFAVRGLYCGAVGIRNTDFIEQTDGVQLLTIAHGEVDDVINKCVGNLMGITFGYRPGTNDETNDIHLRQYGIRNIYAKYATLTNCYANFNEYQNTGHGFQGDDTQKMKCYEGSPLIPCSPSFNPTDVQQGRLYVKDIATPLYNKTVNDYFVLGQTNNKYYRNISNATSCAVCSYSTFTPPACNPPTNGLSPTNTSSSSRVNTIDGQLSSYKFVYPNPVTDKINVQLPILEDSNQNFDYQINIYDVSGNIVKNAVFDSNNSMVQLSCANLPAGIYFIHLSINNIHVSSEKIIKQ